MDGAAPDGSNMQLALPGQVSAAGVGGGGATATNVAPQAAGAFDESSDSEVDLGVLSDTAVRQRARRKQSAMTMGEPFTEEQDERKLLASAIDHIARTLCKRVETMRHVVTAEVRDTRSVSTQLGDVLEVLVRRANDLAVQQSQCLEGIN